MGILPAGTVEKSERNKDMNDLFERTGLCHLATICENTLFERRETPVTRNVHQLTPRELGLALAKRFHSGFLSLYAKKLIIQTKMHVCY